MVIYAAIRPVFAGFEEPSRLDHRSWKETMMMFTRDPVTRALRATCRSVAWTLTAATVLLGGGSAAAAGAPAGAVKIETIGYPIFAISAAHSIWVGSHHGGSVYRIDPASNKIVKTISVGSTPCSEPVAGFGSLFFSNCDEEGQNTIQLSTTTNKVVRMLHGGLPILGDGSVWTIDADGGTVYRYDPQTGVKLAAVATNFVDIAGGGGAYLGTAGAGSVWASDQGSKTVIRIDTATNKVVAVIPLPGAAANAAPNQGYAGGGPMIFAGGKIWAGNPAGIFEINPATNIATLLKIRIGNFQYWGDIPLAVGNGDVWVRTSGSTVTRINPATGSVIASYPTTGGGGGIAVAFGSLWTANAGNETTTRQAVH
jgi:streptogramin lyase